MIAIVPEHAFRFLLDPSSPATQSLALASIALVWIFLRHYRTGAALLVLGALWLALCSTPGFADCLQRGLEDQYPSRPAASYPKADQWAKIAAPFILNISARDNGSSMSVGELEE